AAITPSVSWGNSWRQNHDLFKTRLRENGPCGLIARRPCDGGENIRRRAGRDDLQLPCAAAGPWHRARGWRDRSPQAQHCPRYRVLRIRAAAAAEGGGSRQVAKS